MKRQTPAAQRPSNGKRHPKTPPPEPMVDKDAGLDRAIGIKKKGMGSRTWMKIDQTGIPEMVEADKYAIMRRVSIPARDLRILDPLLSYPSTVLGREKAIVVNLEHIKCIITAEEVLLLNWQKEEVTHLVDDLKIRLPSHYDDQGEQMAGDGGGGLSEIEIVAALKETSRNNTTKRGMGAGGAGMGGGREGPLEASRVLQKVAQAALGLGQSAENESMGMGGMEEEGGGKMKGGGPNALPFEFRALEACLEAACGVLERAARELEEEAYPALDELTGTISTLNLERVRQIKSRLVIISGRVQKVRDELEQLLDDDEDMAEMYLTDKLLAARQPPSSPTSTTISSPPSPSSSRGTSLARQLSDDGRASSLGVAGGNVFEAMGGHRAAAGGGGGDQEGEEEGDLDDEDEALDTFESEYTTSFLKPKKGKGGRGGVRFRTGASNTPEIEMDDSAFSPMGSMGLGASNQGGGGGGGGVRGGLGGLAGVLGSGFASPRFPLSRGDAETLSTTSSREHLKVLDVEELEMLLEAYFVQIEGTLNKLATLREYVEDTEDYINIMLDDKQNSLLQMNILLTTATLSLSMFVVVVGIFGMNIPLWLFDHEDPNNYSVFYYVIGGCTLGVILVFSAVVSYVRHKRLLG